MARTREMSEEPLLSSRVTSSVLDECYPLVLALNFYAAHLGRGLPVQALMGSEVVMIYLIAGNDRRIGLLETPHDLLSISDLSVQAFHFVIIVRSCQVDLSYVVRYSVEPVCSVLSHVCKRIES